MSWNSSANHITHHTVHIPDSTYRLKDYTNINNSYLEHDVNDEWWNVQSNINHNETLQSSHPQQYISRSGAINPTMYNAIDTSQFASNNILYRLKKEQAQKEIEQQTTSTVEEVSTRQDSPTLILRAKTSNMYDPTALQRFYTPYQSQEMTYNIYEYDFPECNIFILSFRPWSAGICIPALNNITTTEARPLSLYYNNYATVYGYNMATAIHESLKKPRVYFMGTEEEVRYFNIPAFKYLMLGVACTNHTFQHLDHIRRTYESDIMISASILDAYMFA